MRYQATRRGRRWSFCIALLLLAFAASHAAWTWQIQRIDSVGNVGQYTSLALDTAGRPCISYYDVTNANLKVAVWTGASWSITSLDTAGSVGQYTSAAIDNQNRKSITYYDVTNGALKYCGYARLPWAWNVQRVDTAGTVGQYTGLSLDTAQRALIGYYDVSGTNLKRAEWTGTAWSVNTVDTTGNLGLYASSAVDLLNRKSISYYDATNGAVKYAGFYRLPWAWATQAVDTGGDVGRYTGLSLDTAQRPLIAYFDGTHSDLKQASWTGSAWQTSAVDTERTVGVYASSAVDGQNRKSIAYYDVTNGAAKYAGYHRLPWDWAVQLVDSQGDVGAYSSLGLNQSGLPRISYWKAGTANDLMFAGYDSVLWNKEVVDSAGAVGQYSSLALNGRFDECISYYSSDSTALKFAHRDRAVDVGVAEIVQPPAVVDSGAIVVPSVLVRNYGTTPDTFPVWFRIHSATGLAVQAVGTTLPAAMLRHSSGATGLERKGGLLDQVYDDSTVVSLAAGGTATVSFDTWVATPPDTYRIEAFTDLAGDQHRANDTARVSLIVRPPQQILDAGVVSIVAPQGSYRVGTEVLPAAVWRNFGTVPVSFDVYAVLTAPGGARHSARTHVALLAPDADTAIQFSTPCTLSSGGRWTVRCSTALAGDMELANDVMLDTFAVGGAWRSMAPMPGPVSGKQVKDGGWLTFDASRGLIYTAKGNKASDFYEYDPAKDSWRALAPIPLGIENKLPSKGASGCASGSGLVYATKGNNTQGFYVYHTADDSWQQLANVPLGTTNKKVKAGADLAYVAGDTDYVYLLKGYRDEFWRYDPAANQWFPLAAVPAARWGAGSWLVHDGLNTLYAHQAKYHGFYPYYLDTRSWGTAMEGMPLVGQSGRSKKSKDGGCAVAFGASLYALKGGNTQEFWTFALPSGPWAELETMPQTPPNGSTKKKVKAGGDITATRDALYALKGNKTLELWSYVPGSALAQVLRERQGVMAKATSLPQRLTLEQTAFNRLQHGASIRYSIPGASHVSLRVYDATGRLVQRLVDWQHKPGYYSVRWNGCDAKGRLCGQGIYFYTLLVDGKQMQRKMLKLR